VFGTSLVAFFLAEMGDKTQITTVALASVLGSEPVSKEYPLAPECLPPRERCTRPPRYCRDGG
jgi:hypothetical protein